MWYIPQHLLYTNALLSVIKKYEDNLDSGPVSRGRYGDDNDLITKQAENGISNKRDKCMSWEFRHERSSFHLRNEKLA